MPNDYFTRVFGLNGRTALVTGSCSGFGLAIARALGHAGAHILINSRHEDRCQDAVALLKADGIGASTAAFDVSDEAAVNSAFARLVDAGIGVDILVANAGTQNRKPVTDMSLDEWHALMAVHVDGAFNCARRVLPGMVSRGFGRIVLMSSVAGQAAMPNVAAYAAAKGALAAFSRALAVEYGACGVTVNSIAPGFARTEFTRALQDNPEFEKFIATAVPAGRWAEPDDIAPAVVFLASPGGSFVNGHLLTLDGGLLAHL